MITKKIIRKHYMLVTIFFVSMLGCCFESHAESLYVFYPTKIPPNILQSKLIAACPGIEIIVFGRFKDFKTNVIEIPPDAILSKEPVVSLFTDYSPNLQGIRNGSTYELYVLLSVDEKVDPNSVTDTSLGILDILGRKGMGDFVKNFLPSKPKLKRATKIEDLLPLLTFNMAKAIIVTDNLVDHFKEISKLNFVFTPIPEMKAGIITLATKKNGSANKIVSAIKGMDKNDIIIMEVDNWKD